MRVGIITLYNNNLNYGALIQTYALKSTIEQLGHEVSVVDYPFRLSQLKYEKQRFSWKYLFYPRRLASYILQESISRKKEERVKKTQKFAQESLNITPLCCDSKEIDNLNFDVHICGSDQIWNPELTDGLKAAFFGGEGKAYKIAYAASVGELGKIKDCKEEFTNLLASVNAISVREYDLFEFIKTNTNYNVAHVLDPSLLLSKEDYENILKKPEEMTPYLLVYSLNRDIGMLKLAHLIARDKNLQVIEITNTKTPFCGHRQIFSADPAEFLGWIAQASFVITNSFHGIALSIVFNKDFLAVKLKNLGSRIQSLLNKLKLENRLVDPPHSFKNTNIQGIAYQNVDEILFKLRTNSLDFVKNALSFND